jgi:hypothetical protein
MKKQFCVAMMVLAVVLSMAGMTTAANHKNMVGTWEGTVYFVGWNSLIQPPEDQFYYDYFQFTYEILSEDFTTGNFYGLETGFYPFTGNVATNKRVTIIVYEADGEYRILTGTVSGKKMTGTMQHFKSDQVDTGTFTFYKQ